MNAVIKLVVVLALAFVGACSKSAEQAQPAATSVEADARKLIANGATVVDVRTPEEFAAGHLPNATNIPVQEFAARIGEVDKLAGGNRAKDIVVYCGSGKRSEKAKTQLEAAGYTRVVNGGGYDDLR